MPAIKGDYFGRLNYGSIFGLSGMVQMAGSMLGTIFAAYVFDTTGDYRFAFLTFAVLLSISAGLFATLTPPRYRQQLSTYIIKPYKNLTLFSPQSFCW